MFKPIFQKGKFLLLNFIFCLLISLLIGSPVSAQELTKAEIGELELANQQNGAAISSLSTAATEENAHLILTVAENGRFTLKTSLGDPDNPNDDYKLLLYEDYRGAWSSFTTVKVDNDAYIYGSPDGTFLTPPTSNSLGNTSIWAIGNIQAEQNLTFVSSQAAEYPGTLEISYTLTNNDTVAHQTGVRVMLDTMLGGNDGAPFRVPGVGAVMHEREFIASGIPEYWQAFDSIETPGVISQGTLQGSGFTTPDRLVLGYWHNIYTNSNPWDYVVNPNQSITLDSAVLVYWDPVTLQPGESKTFVTHYGLSGFTQDLKPPLALSLYAPHQLELNENENGYLPNPYTLVAYVLNNGTVPAENAFAGLSLDPGLVLVPGQDTTVNLGTIAPDEEKLVTWYVYALPRASHEELNNTVTVGANGVLDKTLSRPIKIPALQTISGTGCIDLYKLIDPADRHCSSFAGDPVDTASGAQIINHSLISVRGARPVSFDATYNSLLLKEGPLGKGWGHSFETYLEPLADGNVKIHWNANRENTFVNDGTDNFSTTERAILFDNLVKNADGAYTLTRRDQSVYLFDARGKLVEHKNRNGQTLTMAYDASGLLQTITEPISGQFLSIRHNDSGLIDHVIDPLNRTVSFAYDESRNLTGITDTLGRTTSYTYNADGRVLTDTDAGGKQLFANTYDIMGRVETQDDGRTDNQLIMFSYNEQSRPGKVITTVTGRDGKSRILIHNKKYQLESVLDQLGYTTTYTYDDDGNCNGVTDGNGHTTGLTYDDRGNMSTQTDALGQVTTMTYDQRNNLKTITNNAGKVGAFNYDTNNNLTSVFDTLGNTTSFNYNANGLLETMTMPRSGQTSWTYAGGLPETVTDPAGNTTIFGYDAAGRLTNITDPAGKTSYIAYDNGDNVQTLTDPLNNSVSFTYDNRDNMLTQTDARGYTTTLTYDDNGNLETTTDPLNNITWYRYDGEDRLVKVIDARGNATTYTRDDKGRLIGVTCPLGYTLSYEYDAADNLTGAWDRKGIKASTITYDAVNNPKTVTDALNRTVASDYDNLNRLNRVTDPAGHSTQYGYDDLDRLISVIDAMGGTSSQTFDANGNRNTLADPNGNQTVFHFDLAGRLTGETSAAGYTLSLAYNTRNLPEQVTNGRGQNITYTYDDAGRVKTATDPTGTVSYTYDENGKLLTVTDNSGAITREYDALNRVKKYTDARGNIIQYAYDAVGNLETLTYPGGRQVTYLYNQANLLKTVTDWAGRATTYDYDQNGRVVTITRSNGTVLTCDYDDAGQLLQMKDVDAEGNVLTRYDFNYDSVGNVVSEVPAIAPQPFTVSDAAMTYTSDNCLATYNGQLVEYDADGNMTHGPLNGQMATFTYDARNQLTGAGGITYHYDAEGNRISVTDGVYNTRADYTVNPHAPLSQVLVKTDAQSDQTYYVYGLGLIGQEGNGVYRTYHFDLRGSTVALTDENGIITDRFQYGPYSELVKHEGETKTPFLYNGQDGVITDANGLYYMRARYYNYESKRFINKDILLGSIEEGQSLNRYVFVTNNPVNYIDPSGNFVIIPAVGIAAVAEAGGAAVLGTAAILATKELVETIENYWRNRDPATGIVYLRSTTTGEMYVGSVKSEERYIKRIQEHQRERVKKNLHHDPYIFNRLEWNIPLSQLRIREQCQIIKLGGAQSMGGTLQNKINAISPNKWGEYRIK